MVLVDDSLPPMKLLFTQARDTRAGGADDNLGRGMETALLLAFFLGIGWLVDRWLGTRPLFMIGLVLFAATAAWNVSKLSVVMLHKRGRHDDDSRYVDV
jgi:MFS family permease